MLARAGTQQKDGKKKQEKGEKTEIFYMDGHHYLNILSRAANAAALRSRNTDKGTSENPNLCVARLTSGRRTRGKL
jgi:hypothetical protein